MHEEKQNAASREPRGWVYVTMTMQGECSCQDVVRCAPMIPTMRQGSADCDVISGEQHSVRIVREVQNDDSLIVRCTKWHNT
jgi:hypothetical protein